MVERIREFLAERPEGATSEDIAAQVLRLKGARGTVADRVVDAALAEDRQVARGGDGIWRLRSASRALKGAEFVSIGVRSSPPEDGPEQLVGLAAMRCSLGGQPRWFPEVQVVGGDGEALESFAAFVEGEMPAAFRLPRVRRLVNGSALASLGRPVVAEGLCLYRLGRLGFPDRLLGTVEDLAEAAGAAYLTERGPQEEAALQGDLLLRLLELRKKADEDTVEAVLADLHPDRAPVDFEAYAFDEAFLGELPQSPGIYVMRDQQGRVIYVGKSVSLRDRVGTYFSRRSERPEKTKRILDRIWSVEVETVGSELEALLLEARLIRLCRPEFNTQVDVHDRASGAAADGDFVLLLPSVEPDSVELFCIGEGRPPEQHRARRDLSDWEGVSRQVRALYFGNDEPPGPLAEDDAADLEILRSWVARNMDAVNRVDMQAVGGPDEALRVLEDYVRGCDLEGWEKVWRI